MRIFYASDTTPNSNFVSNLWRNNLYESLLDLGHEVIEFQYDAMRETFQHLEKSDPLHHAFIEKNRPRLSKELLSQISREHAKKPIDLFFSYFYDACVEAQTIDAIRSLGIKTMNWYCNGSYQLHLVSEIAPHYDWCLVPEKFRLKDYRELGANPIYCQEAANPKIYKPYSLPQEFDVTFVGQAYGDRPAYIRYLLDQGIPVRVWGAHWKKYAVSSRGTAARAAGKLSAVVNRAKRVSAQSLTQEGRRTLLQKAVTRLSAGTQEKNAVASPQVRLPESIMGGFLEDAELVRLFSRSKINLGFSNCGDLVLRGEKITQVRLRDFEVPMSGGFYMVEYMEELEEFYRIGEEIVCYRGPEDLAEKVKYYLAHPEEREKIRKAGYDRCLRDHSWQKRFQTVFKQVGLDPKR